MIFLLLAALFSVAVSLLLKWAKAQGYAPVALVSWNYVAALLLCWFSLAPDVHGLLDGAHVPWLAFMALGLLLPAVFLALASSLQRTGLIRTEVAQRMSVLLSLLAAFFLFSEHFTWLKGGAIAVGILAVLGLVVNSGAASAKAPVLIGKASGLLLLVWVGYAGVDILLKYISTLGFSSATALFCSFAIALLVLVLKQLFSKRAIQRVLDVKHMLFGLLLGVLNFCNIWFYIRAHQQLADNPAIVFASMNILVVLLGVLAGVAIFKERLKPPAWFFVLLSLVAILILYYARLS